MITWKTFLGMTEILRCYQCHGIQKLLSKQARSAAFRVFRHKGDTYPWVTKSLHCNYTGIKAIMITMVIKLSKYNIQYKKKQPRSAAFRIQRVPSVSLKTFANGVTRRPGLDALIFRD